MYYENHYYYLAFSHFQKIGPIAMKKLERSFPDMRQAFFAGATELERAELRPLVAAEFINWRKTPAAAIENMIGVLERENISFITWKDTDYPALLKEISSPPFVLYYKGVLGGPKNRLAVVGSRKNSAYGEKIVSDLLPAVIRHNINIISGLALGIDALAHQTALNNGGVTWAIMGSGLDDKNIYPHANRRLARQILENGGALISEFPPGTPPYKQNFPQRNRIIAGLAQATLVIEAKIKSGALITAHYALDSNREILAVPGNIFSEFSDGPNKLIQAGAKTIKNSEDILEVYGLTDSDNDDNWKKSKKLTKRYAAEQPCFSPDNPEEARIYRLLRDASERAEKIDVDEIAKETKLDTSVINSTLSILELRGIAKNSESGYDLN